MAIFITVRIPVNNVCEERNSCTEVIYQSFIIPLFLKVVSQTKCVSHELTRTNSAFWLDLICRHFELLWFWIVLILFFLLYGWMVLHIGRMAELLEISFRSSRHSWASLTWSICKWRTYMLCLHSGHISVCQLTWRGFIVISLFRLLTLKGQCGANGGDLNCEPRVDWWSQGPLLSSTVWEALVWINRWRAWYALV